MHGSFMAISSTGIMVNPMPLGHSTDGFYDHGTTTTFFHTGWCLRLSQVALQPKYENYRMWGRYYEQISGVINQQTYLGPGAPICNIPYLQFY